MKPTIAITRLPKEVHRVWVITWVFKIENAANKIPLKIRNTLVRSDIKRPSCIRS
ncbi:hypothetical protein [Nitrosarchaeum sp. AC2]|uniref:hypothetical protein n=1 Tax=Nitrosarchaeum sp. AC2 TaxID=2259673 RepID=UPI0015CD1CAD|nr:hypothetical protein [Nitrosarchaeum sp. AC2]